VVWWKLGDLEAVGMPSLPAPPPTADSQFMWKNYAAVSVLP
jgi:hypothetical protein